MTIGARLREERQRLGINQTDFAAIAGASKRAMVSWEKNETAPLVTQLTAWSDAGVDALYVLTGRRTNLRPDSAANQIEDQLAGIRRDLVDAGRVMISNESEKESRERYVGRSVSALKAILHYDTRFLSSDQIAEVERLLDIAENPASLSLYQAADYAQLRRQREDIKDRLSGWFEDGPYSPGESVTKALTTLAIEYSVPIRFLVEIAYEFHSDISSRHPQSRDDYEHRA